ncbi:MAG: DnaA/Hda family protein [Bacteroidota bacterium]
MENQIKLFNSVTRRNLMFGTFIEQENNAFATAFGKLAIHTPASLFNPMTITGEASSGKTQFLDSIYYSMRMKMPDSKLIFIRSNAFCLQFEYAMQNKCIIDFFNYYANANSLFIDDIDYLQQKMDVQAVLLQIIDQMHNSIGKLFFASSIQPQELSGFDAGLLSEINRGLVLHLHKPDRKTKLEILQTKVMRMNTNVPDKVLESLVQNDTLSITELENVLMNLLAKSVVLNSKMNLELLQAVLNETTGQFGNNNI